jgi:MOSC domain-containing protein YiiM
MKVIATNIGERRQVSWRGKKVETGIFKSPVSDGIFLGSTDVQNDHVVDRKWHGGVDKACYLFSAEAYTHFKKWHPQLNWDWGMFGENVTIEGLDESEIMIGSQYQIGEAIVEVSEPRQPCFKLGVRFGTQKILKQFIAHDRPGVYVRVLQQGFVRPEDEMVLIESGSSISIQDIHQLMFRKHANPMLLEEALKLEKLAESSKVDLRKSLS